MTKRFDLLLSEALSFDGEYWIQNGQAVYADGDIGQVNHEAVVVQEVFGELVDALAESPRFNTLAAIWSELFDSDGVDVIGAVEYMNNHADELYTEGIITQDELDDIEETIRLEIGWPELKMRVALGREDDARVYGIQELGWIRVQGIHIQLWGLTKSTLEELAEGLYDCHGESWTDAEYFIEDSKTNKVYRGVPGAVIDAGDLGYLRNYSI